MSPKAKLLFFLYDIKKKFTKERHVKVFEAQKKKSLTVCKLLLNFGFLFEI